LDDYTKKNPANQNYGSYQKELSINKTLYVLSLLRQISLMPDSYSGRFRTRKYNADR